MRRLKLVQEPITFLESAHRATTSHLMAEKGNGQPKSDLRLAKHATPTLARFQAS